MTQRIYLDLLKVIRHKLEVKKEVTDWDGFVLAEARSAAFDEAIALIDEALAELKEETNE